MRHCILGNSHTFAIRNAWLGENGLPGEEPTFFLAAGSALAVKAEAGRIVPANRHVAERFSSWADQDEIAPDDFDAFWVIGAGLRAPHFMKLCTTHGWPESVTPWFPGVPVVSDDTFTALAGAQIRTSPALRAVRAIRAVTDKPLFVVPEPLIGHGVLEKKPAFAALVEHEAVEQMAALWRQLLQTEVERHSVNGIVHPPDVLRASPFTTVDSYRAQEDYLHMDERYGASVLNDVVRPLIETIDPAKVAQPV